MEKEREESFSFARLRDSVLDSKFELTKGNFLVTLNFRLMASMSELVKSYDPLFSFLTPLLPLHQTPLWSHSLETTHTHTRTRVARTNDLSSFLRLPGASIYRENSSSTSLVSGSLINVLSQFGKPKKLPFHIFFDFFLYACKIQFSHRIWSIDESRGWKIVCSIFSNFLSKICINQNSRSFDF